MHVKYNYNNTILHLSRQYFNFNIDAKLKEIRFQLIIFNIKAAS